MGRGSAEHLTTRMVVMVMAALLVVFGGEAWLRLRQDVAAFQVDMERDHQSIARVLKVSLAQQNEPGEVGELLALLAQAGFDSGQLQVSRVALDGVAANTERPRTPPELLGAVAEGSPVHWVGEDEHGERWLHTTVATRASGPGGPWIEVVESLSGQSAFVRAAVQRVLVTLVLCLLIAGGAVAWLGRRLVARQ